MQLVLQVTGQDDVHFPWQSQERHSAITADMFRCQGCPSGAHGLRGYRPLCPHQHPWMIDPPSRWSTGGNLLAPNKLIHVGDGLAMVLPHEFPSCAVRPMTFHGSEAHRLKISVYSVDTHGGKCRPSKSPYTEAPKVADQYRSSKMLSLRTGKRNGPLRIVINQVHTCARPPVRFLFSPVCNMPEQQAPPARPTGVQPGSPVLQTIANTLRCAHNIGPLLAPVQAQRQVFRSTHQVAMHHGGRRTPSTRCDVISGHLRLQ